MDTRAALQDAYRLIKAGDKAEAAALLRKVLKQDSENVTAWWLLANALTDRRQIQQALEKVIDLDPFHDKATEKLARLKAGVATNVEGAKRTTSTLVNRIETHDQREVTSSSRLGLIAVVVGVLVLIGVLAFAAMNLGGEDDTASVVTVPTAAPTFAPTQPITPTITEVASLPTDAPSATPLPTETPDTLPPTWTPVGGVAAPGVSSSSNVTQANFGGVGQVPRFDQHRCEVEIPGWAFDGRDVICGDLVVPASWSNPTGPSFRVAVAILKSATVDPRPDPLVVLQGGPGGSSVDTFTTWIMEFYQESFLAERDVILIDQRGTLYSEPFLDCRQLDEAHIELFRERLTPQEESLRLQQALTECRTRLEGQGIALANFNSLDNAADIAALRQVLGYEEYNLYGVSYGSLLALHVMKHHPEGLRSVTIDAVVPPQVNYMTELAANAEDVFDRFFERCAADAECNRNFPDLENVFGTLVQRLNTEPITISIEHPVTGSLYDEIYITGDRLIDIVFQSMYSTSSIPALPRMIYDIYNGNTILLRKSFREVTFDESFSEGVYYSVNCYEDGLFDPSEIRTEGVRDYLGSYYATTALSHRDLCNAWGVADAGAALDEAVVSDIPVLIYVGEFDPIIGSQWGLMVSETLSQSKVYIFPGAGHGAAFDGDCPLSIMLAFLEAPATTPSPACIRDMDVLFSPPTGDLYEDPQGRYMVAAPLGWDVVPSTTYVNFADPETGANIYITAVNQRDLATGIGAALQQVFPNFYGTFLGTEGFELFGDTWQLYIYEFEGEYVLAAGVRNEGITYAAITRAEDILEVLYSGVLPELLLGFDYK